MKVWLDDVREPPDSSWVWTKNVSETVLLLQTRTVDEMSLDHDLGDESVVGKGYDVVRWIEEFAFNDDTYAPPIINIHSANPVGIANMAIGIRSIHNIVKKRGAK
jgi:hypothetical protein